MPQADHTAPKPPPNRKLRAARSALASPSGAPGMCMTRRELAEAANDYVWKHKGQQTNLSERDIGRYERGEAHWPDHWRRYALRGVLGVNSDSDLASTPTEGPPPYRLSLAATRAALTTQAKEWASM